jgi:cell division protein ZapA
MPIVTVTINEKSYQIACDPGQEARLQRVAGMFDQRVKKVRAQSIQINHELSLIISALLVENDYLEMSENKISTISSSDSDTDIVIAEALDSIAGYIEKIAVSMDND